MTQKNSVYKAFHELLRELDDCPDTYKSGTIGRGIDEVKYPYLALLGSLTYADIRSFTHANSKLWNDGTFARMIFAVPRPDESPRSTIHPKGDDTMPDSIVNSLRDYHDRLGIPQVQMEEYLEGTDDESTRQRSRFRVESIDYPEKTIDISNEVLQGHKRYTDGLHQIVSQMDIEDLNAAYVRFPEKAMRIAVMFAFLGHSETVEIKHYAKAQQLTEMWRVCLHQLYNLTNSSPDKDKILEEGILKYLGKQKVACEVRKINGAVKEFTADKVRKTCQYLANEGLLIEVTQGKNKPWYQIPQ
jgi:hypothetical protein